MNGYTAFREEVMAMSERAPGQAAIGALDLIEIISLSRAYPV